MKKVILTATMLVTMSTLFFASCNKRSNGVENQKNAKASSQVVTTSIPANFDFTKFGVAHNDYLDFLSTNPGFDPNAKKVNYAYGRTYGGLFSAAFQNAETWDAFQPKLSYVDGLTDGIFNGINPSVQLLNDNKVSADMAAFLDELAAIYVQAGDETAGTYYSIADFENAINVLEDEVKANGNIILNETTLEANDNAAKIAICEIAKSSYAYWINIAEGNGNIGWATNGGMQTMSFLGKVWRAIKIAAVDSYGFVVGGFNSETGIWSWHVAVQEASDGSGAI